MSTSLTTPAATDRPPPPDPAGGLVDRLDSGDRYTSAEFMAIYERTPPGFRAQLIDGVVYVASPISTDHGGPENDVRLWLNRYYPVTPGVRSYGPLTYQLGPLDNPEPDASLILLPECGGRTRRKGRYLAGPPELAVEVAYSSRSIDLGAKRASYEAAGVREYLVFDIQRSQVLWLALREGRHEPIEPAADGLLRSSVFPGLWLDPAAMIGGDPAGIARAVDLGTATPEHAAFVASLAAARG